MNHKAEYDPINNIQFFQFLGTPKSIEDVDYIINKNKEAFQKLSGKAWLITDLSDMANASPAILAEFGKRSVPLVERYGIEEFVCTHKSIQRVMISVYNRFSGSKIKVFKTREDAEKHIFERQKTVGVTKSF